MPEIVSLGAISLDGILLTAVLSAAAGLTGLFIWIRLDKQLQGGPWIDMLFNVLFIIGICWKLGFLARDPSLLWERPSSLLIVRGSAWDALAGLLVSVIYLIIAAGRRDIKLSVLSAVIPLALLPSMIVWAMLTSVPYRIPYAVLFAILYITLIRLRRNGKSLTEMLQSYLLGAGIGGMAVSLFVPWSPGGPVHLLFGLTAAQWLFAGHAICGAFIRGTSVTMQESADRE